MSGLVSPRNSGPPLSGAERPELHVRASQSAGWKSALRKKGRRYTEPSRDRTAGAAVLHEHDSGLINQAMVDSVEG